MYWCCHVLQVIIPGSRKNLSYTHYTGYQNIRDIGVAMYSTTGYPPWYQEISLLYIEYQNIWDIGVAIYSKISSQEISLLLQNIRISGILVLPCTPGYPPWYQEIVGGGPKSTYTIIYIKPCELVVGELIGELRGYGPLDNVGRASITGRASIAAEPLSLSEHWFALLSDSGADILHWLH